MADGIERQRLVATAAKLIHAGRAVAGMVLKAKIDGLGTAACDVTNMEEDRRIRCVRPVLWKEGGSSAAPNIDGRETHRELEDSA